MNEKDFNILEDMLKDCLNVDECSVHRNPDFNTATVSLHVIVDILNSRGILNFDKVIVALKESKFAKRLSEPYVSQIEQLKKQVDELQKYKVYYDLEKEKYNCKLSKGGSGE